MIFSNLQERECRMNSGIKEILGIVESHKGI